MGPYNKGDVFYFTFPTTTLAGVPITLSGTPELSVYENNSTTQTTTGPTLIVDFDGITGLNNVEIDTSDSFYEAGKDYSVVITTGTVDSVSVVGYVVGRFSLRAVPSDVVAVAGTTTSLLNTFVPQFSFSNHSTTDKYGIFWNRYDGSVADTETIASVTLDVVAMSDGSALITAASMSEVGSTNAFYYAESSDRVTEGLLYIADITATIDGTEYTFRKIFGVKEVAVTGSGGSVWFGDS